ncbi:MAG: discoidin domain-containing protein [Planctomycetota bacterium]|nr:discoidin domain-containing protein [Planctomycetota bacterium]
MVIQTVWKSLSWIRSHTKVACSVAMIAAMSAVPTRAVLAADGLAAIGATAKPADVAVAAEQVRKQIEADWLLSLAVPVSTRSDAVGACDGVKDGKYGFHTGQEANPWWQVDLGERRAIGRIVVYNRLDYEPGLHNADNLTIQTSDDGKTWMVRYENKGRYFGGVGGKPLEVTFEPGQPRARFVRLRIPSDRPIFFHLDEVEIYGPGATGQNLALHRAADQISLSPWSTAKVREVRYPTRDVIERGRRSAAELAKAGVEVRGHLRALDEVSGRLGGMGAEAGEEVQRKLYLEARWAVRRVVFANPLLNFERLLFVKRFTQETYPDICLNHMPWVSRPGGDICILSAAGGGKLFEAVSEGQSVKVRHVLNGALGPGHVHGMDLWWDGDRAVFGYARARSDQPPAGWLDRMQSYRLRRSEKAIQIFEVGMDGKNVRQLTNGEWSDLDPTYLPSGDIAFVSERCGTSLQCNEYDKDETSCNLYVMRPDGTRIRRLSVNKDGDYLPHALDDGTIGYTRWEYHERSWAFIQSIWTIRPDGTFADAIFKQHFVDPWAMEDMRSIPGSRKLVAIAAGHHTLAVGPVVVVNHAVGINEPAGIGIVTPGVRPPEGGMDGIRVPEGGVMDGGGFYSTPWALSEKHFLVSYTYGLERDPAGYGLYLIDVFGNKELIYRDPAISCFIPIPLRARFKPPVLADQTDPARNHATCVLSNAAYGVSGIEAHRIRYIRIAEPIGWPYDNQRGGQRYGEDHGYGGAGAERKNLTNWTPVRIIGTVPVESDGSAHFQVPVETAVYFQLLDEKQMELRRMRSFISFQPGEVRGCAGCHETQAAAPAMGRPPMAALRAASIPVPPPWGDRPISFLRDIQPVLDRHCVGCHSGLKPAGGVDLFGGLVTYDPQIAGYGHNRAYETILEKGLVVLSAVRQQDASITPALAYGSHKSKLVTALSQGAHVGKVKLSEDERLRLVTWIDANAPYHDAFVNKRPEKVAYDLAGDSELVRSLTAVHERRCVSCHKPAAVSRSDWIDINEPRRSLFLAAPLQGTEDAGRKCRGGYANASDPDYQQVLLLVESAVRRQWANPRRDVQSLKR